MLFLLGDESKEPVSDLTTTELCCHRNGSILHRKEIGAGLHPTSLTLSQRSHFVL